jgi:rhomboid family GlyGly-CTERM serine protease
MNKRSSLVAAITLMITSVVLYFFQTQTLPFLEFSRMAITNGEYWRLLTGNIMHTNHWHLIFNLAGLIMLTHLFHHLMSNLHFMVFSIINTSLVGMMLYSLSKTIEYYVGLSGYLHGLFVYGCLIEIYKGRTSSWLLLTGVCAKIGYETFYGASEEMSELINANVATDAHLFGALLAVPQFAMLVVYERLIKSTPSTTNI